MTKIHLGSLIQENDPYLRFGNPFVIAEAGVNHEGDMDTAKRLIHEAKEGGADAIKFQTYKAETLASKFSPAYWDTTKEPTQSQYELFKKHDSFWKNEYEALAQECTKAEIEFLSTPFDVESVDFLDGLMSCYKISSSDLNNLPFIRHILTKRKPILLSTGASLHEEIKQISDLIIAQGQQVALMHCVLNYPTLDENAHLARITALKQHFPHLIIGYSDHTLPGDMSILVQSSLMGATIIEKHFTHDKSLPGNDHYHAMDKEDLKVYRQKMAELQVNLGPKDLTYGDTENISRQNARRSLVAAQAIKAGELITPAHITWKRPGTGISPMLYDQLIGKTAVAHIEKDELISWDKIKQHD